jgi:hypothetical protein
MKKPPFATPDRARGPRLSWLALFATKTTDSQHFFSPMGKFTPDLEGVNDPKGVRSPFIESVLVTSRHFTFFADLISWSLV